MVTPDRIQNSIVDPACLLRISGCDRKHLAVQIPKDPHGIRQVILTLGGFVGEPGQNFNQGLSLETIESRIDLLDLSLFGRRIRFLDDLKDVAAS
jgi:hypothetical protein